MRSAWLLCCVVGVAPPAWADPITYAGALARAETAAPSIEAGKAAAQSARLAVGPAGELPDPELAVGIDNFPVSGPDRYSLNRDEMTMLSAGIMQDVPSGAVRKARTGYASAEARQAEADLGIARLTARLSVAAAWIDLFTAERRVAILRDIAGDIAELGRTTSARLAAATGTPDAALAAKMDAVRIANDIAAAEAEAKAARAELERWIGQLGPDSVGPALPVFDIDPAELRQHVEHHVALTGSSAALDRARAGVEIARAGTQPDWSWSLMYGRRDDSFGDMVSFGLKFQLPLFQASRQSPMIDSKRADVTRAAAERGAVLREHRAMLEARLAARAALSERLARVNEALLPLAQQREDLAKASNAAGALPAVDFINARRANREAQLGRIDLERQLALVSAQLTLEYGEAQP
jgi:outer membrane protein, heavy metal efflux system